MRTALLVAVLLGLCLSVSADSSNGVGCGACKFISRAIWDYSEGNYTKSIDDRDAFCLKVAPGGLQNPFFLLCYAITNNYVGDILLTSSCLAENPSYSIDQCITFTCSREPFRFCDEPEKNNVAALAAPAKKSEDNGILSCPGCKLITTAAYTAAKGHAANLTEAAEHFCAAVAPEGSASARYWFCHTAFSKAAFLIDSVDACVATGKTVSDCTAKICVEEFKLCPKLLGCHGAPSGPSVRIVDIKEEGKQVAKGEDAQNNPISCAVCKAGAKLTYNALVAHRDQVLDNIQKFCMTITGGDAAFYIICMLFSAQPVHTVDSVEFCLGKGHDMDWCVQDLCAVTQTCPQPQ